MSNYTQRIRDWMDYRREFKEEQEIEALEKILDEYGAKIKSSYPVGSSR